ncbi:MAG: hypothetical protein NWE89_08780 [Candidatus Bathyarchaeota archaeon]|nr:hypothetical protein [Candidatus Bathyarchaeota archaeon]
MTEQSLHNQLKDWYTEPGDSVESTVDGYIIDVVKGDLLIEIQTQSFSSIKPKLERLVKKHRVMLVHPVPQRKWVIRLDSDGKEVGRRRSPKRGRVEEVFRELVYMPHLVKHRNLELEILLVDMEEYLIDDGKGSWRRRRWSIHNRTLLEVKERHVFKEPRDFLRLLPDALPEEFTSGELAKAAKLRPRLSQKMMYCLRLMGVLEVTGKKRRSNLYRISV